MKTPATLLGLAIGDALGMAFEMSAYDDPRLKNWDGSFRDGSRSPYTKDLRAGQWTDDTKMAIALSKSLIEAETYSPAAAARNYLAWFQSGDLRGIGTSTYQAMTRLQMGLPWTQSGVPGAEGNGTAMRIAPMGVLFRTNIQAAAEMAAIDARITHRSEEAVVGSMAVALGVTSLLQGVAPENVIPKVLEWLPESQIRARLVAVARLTEAGVGQDARTVAQAVAAIGAGAHVVQTVPAAFLAFVGTQSFEAAVQAAIYCGGDTDTTAAVAGALAGTFYGLEAVRPYLDQLEGAAELQSLDHQLFETARPMY